MAFPSRFLRSGVRTGATHAGAKPLARLASALRSMTPRPDFPPWRRNLHSTPVAASPVSLNPTKPLNILFLTNAHNSMSQRAYLELTYRCGHNVNVELAINEDQMEGAVAEHRPDLIICPFLTKRVPESIWRNPDIPCLVVHPGVHGDRGISAIDWALLNEEPEWGVTVLQAVEEMDAGDIWATHNFKVPAGKHGHGATKSGLYQEQCLEAAMEGLYEAVAKFQAGVAPTPLDYSDPNVKGTLMPNMKAKDRVADFAQPAAAVARRIRVSDTSPGVLHTLGDQQVFLYGATADKSEASYAAPGDVTAVREDAVRIQCGSGSVWVSHMKAKGKGNFKLPAAAVVDAGVLARVPSLASPELYLPHGEAPRTHQEVWATVDGPVAYLHFDFYNGAMSTAQCRRLQAAVESIDRRSDVRVVVLMGGSSFFSNGIHLNTIEAAEDPAAESWDNINAINDVVRAVFNMTSKVTVAAVQGNAGAGGVMAALAADYVWTHRNVILNPHYKSMALYGSEYWTYFLPQRVGPAMAAALTDAMQPILGEQAAAVGLVDRILSDHKAGFADAVEFAARSLVYDGAAVDEVLEGKAVRRTGAWQEHVEAHRKAELAKMRACFASEEYNAARAAFVHKVPATVTPDHLAHAVEPIPSASGALLEPVLDFGRLAEAAGEREVEQNYAVAAGGVAAAERAAGTGSPRV